mgnify:CR=1 FL=1
MRDAGTDALRLRAFFSFAATLGFGSVSYVSARYPEVLMVADDQRMRSIQLAWRERYLAMEYLRSDAMVHRAVRTALPVEWMAANPEPGLGKVQSRIFREAYEHGLRGGLVIPLSDTRGDAAIGLFHDARSGVSCRIAEIALLHFAGAFLHDQMQAPDVNRIRLSARERECLSWIRAGLTASEIADRLRISESTVVFHLKNGRAKLGAATTAQALARAVTLKLL